MATDFLAVILQWQLCRHCSKHGVATRRCGEAQILARRDGWVFYVMEATPG